MSEGTIFDIKELAVHDGPGIRTTVFFKGCPLRCRWCHNPEGLSPRPQLMVSANGCSGCGLCLRGCGHPECAPFQRCTKICLKQLVKVAGYRISAAELAKQLKRLEPLLVDGGVTISGGEPLMQPQFLLELLGELAPMHTIVETSGYAPPEVFRAAAAACSTVYLDIKHTDSLRHRDLTGVGNERILGNLEWLRVGEIPFLVRVPLIPGCNDDEENLERTARLLRGAKNLLGVELLPYNPFAGAKYAQLGLDFSLEGLNPPPPAEALTEIFCKLGVDCVLLPSAAK